MGKENLYKTITETVPEFFFVYNLLEDKVTFVSPNFFELADGNHSDPQKKDLRSYIHPDDQESFDTFFAQLSEKNDFSHRIELRTSQDLESIKWIEINTFPVDNGVEPVEQVVAHIIDITEKKDRIVLLENEQEKLDSILKILAHDLRAPFSQVYMISEILRNMMSKEETEKFGMYIGMLRQLGNRSIHLLDNLLRLVALQEGTLSLELKKHDLKELLHSIKAASEVNLAEKQISCTIQEPDFAVVGEVDCLLLEQALSNLLSNAIKFTPEGGRISLKIAQQDKVAEIEVEDSGIGIPEKHVPDLFQEFPKFRRKGLRGEKSTGLGLAICKQIIKLHKGSISVKSQENKGTHFTIRLPLTFP